jgi:hypothetical protein
MLASPGYECEFKVVRDDVEDKAVTFSRDALEELHRHLALFIGTRVMREWERAEAPPKTMTVRVEVAFE